MLPSRWNTPPATRAGRLAVFAPALLWYALICFFSSQTGDESSQLSNLVVENSIDWMGDWGAIFRVDWDALQLLSFLVRKCAHMGVFFILTGLLLFALWRLGASPRARAGLSLGLCALLAGLDEFHQTFVPGRDGKLPDVLIDLGGGVCFLLLWLLARHLRRRREEAGASPSHLP